MLLASIYYITCHVLSVRLLHALAFEVVALVVVSRQVSNFIAVGGDSVTHLLPLCVSHLLYNLLLRQAFMATLLEYHLVVHALEVG